MKTPPYITPIDKKYPHQKQGKIYRITRKANCNNTPKRGNMGKLHNYATTNTLEILVPQ